MGVLTDAALPQTSDLAKIISRERQALYHDHLTVIGKYNPMSDLHLEPLPKQKEQCFHEVCYPKSFVAFNQAIQRFQYNFNLYRPI